MNHLEKNQLCNFSLLYVEDEEDIREELKTFLEQRVKVLYLASNGKEGLEMFHTFKPDIVISDINMPDMDGILMSEEIKKNDKKIPIILTTAMSDANYMTKAIKIGIDRYLLKPIRLKNLEEALNEVAHSLMYSVIEEKLKEDERLISTLNGFMDFGPNPVIIYNSFGVKFVNKAFEKISGQTKSELEGSNFALNSLFENRSGYLTSLDELKEDHKENKVSIKSTYGRHIYYLLENAVDGSFGETFIMYTFNDITLNEYHKIKMEHYNFRLEDFIKQINRLRSEKSFSLPEQNETLSAYKEEIQVVEREKRELSAIETRILKKTRAGAVFTAEEYNNEVDEYILQELHELEEIDAEINDALTDYEEQKNIERLYFIAGRLVKYSSVIAQLFEFEDLAFAIKSLSDLLAGVEPEIMTNIKHRKLNIFLANFMMDIATWRRTIFIEKNTHDIHYLDASLFSAILQLELVVNEKEAVVADEDEDDSFELF